MHIGPPQDDNQQPEPKEEQKPAESGEKVHIEAESKAPEPPAQAQKPSSEPVKTHETAVKSAQGGMRISHDASVDTTIDFDELLDLCIDSDSSDLHIAENERIAMRINGKITFIDNVPKLNKKQAEDLIFGMIQNSLHKERLEQTKELDMAYEHKDGTTFRVNIFYKRGAIATVMRVIGREAPSIEDLKMPDAVKELLHKKQGLILVTGPTGSGKSTSMQSMLEFINQKRVDHIVTIEDPIEFVFDSKKSIFSQREVGEDTLSFSNALRAVLREDPDVVMIGEMRDPETIMAAMNLSETGHLVISTLHTSGAPQTIHRLVNAFPPEHHSQIQTRLADTLIGVLSQRLVPRIDKPGRIAIYELMIVNGAIRNVIRTGEFSQLYNSMMAGRQEGMVTMQDYAYKLANEGVIHEGDFIHFFREE